MRSAPKIAIAGALGLIGGGLGHFYTARRIWGCVYAIADALAGTVLYLDYTCYPPSGSLGNANDWQIMLVIVAVGHGVQMVHSLGCAMNHE